MIYFYLIQYIIFMRRIFFARFFFIWCHLDLQRRIRRRFYGAKKRFKIFNRARGVQIFNKLKKKSLIPSKKNHEIFSRIIHYLLAPEKSCSALNKFNYLKWKFSILYLSLK